MIQKKICLLGGFAVGKTSLIRRFVTGMFSELYQTTIGVTIEKKTLIAVDPHGQNFLLVPEEGVEPAGYTLSVLLLHEDQWVR